MKSVCVCCPRYNGSKPCCRLCATAFVPYFHKPAVQDQPINSMGVFTPRADTFGRALPDIPSKAEPTTFFLQAGDLETRMSVTDDNVLTAVGQEERTDIGITHKQSRWHRDHRENSSLPHDETPATHLDPLQPSHGRRVGAVVGSSVQLDRSRPVCHKNDML